MTDVPHGNDAFPTGAASTLSPLAQAHSRHGERADIARRVIAHLVDRAISARRPDAPRGFGWTAFLRHIVPDSVVHAVLDGSGDTSHPGVIADIAEMISAFSGLTPAKAHFYVHQALLRAKTGRDMESDVPAAEILPVRSREMLPVAFAREVSERMVAFAAQHFSEPPDGADALVHFVIGQEVWYLSDKLDDVGIRILEQAYALDGENGVLSRLSVWLRSDTDMPAMERMRRHLVRILGMPEPRSDVFLRFARPYLDTAYARCFARYMRDRTE